MATELLKIKQIPNVQDMLYCLGQEGCLFLVLCILAERLGNKRIDVLRSAYDAIDDGLVDYIYTDPRNHLKEAFWVRDRDKLLSVLSGVECSTKKVKALPKNYNGLYYLQYKNGKYTHFILPDYNTMYYSNTVHNGEVEYYVLVLSKNEERKCG